MVYKLRIHAHIRIFLALTVALLLVFGAYRAFAQEREPDIAFPVAELGNCQNKEECKAYCDEVAHIAECVDFAERHGLMRGAELEEAKKVARALAQGAQLPGGCRGKEECEAYCQEPSHMEECVEFALAAGFIPPQEAEEVRRVLPLMKEGRMPGGCRDRESCEVYCSEDEHVEECTAFFVEAGFMSAEEAEMFRKTGGRGPGGCQGREECEAFCNDPANQKECFAFAKEHGLIPEEELHNLEEGIGRFREGLENAPPEVAQCLRDTIGEKVLAKIEAGNFLPNPELGEHMRQCFDRFMPRPEEFGPEGGERTMAPAAAGCVERILGDVRQLQGPPTPEQEQRIREECFPQQPSHPEDFGEFAPFEGEVPEQFREEYERQFQEEFQQQFEQRREEFEGQFEHNTPEGFQPPEGFEFPEDFHPEESSPTQTAPSEPEARLPRQSFLGAVVEAMKPGLRILFPFLPF